MALQQTLFWLDLEMTGLVTETDLILQIAAVVTDNDLQVIAEGPELIISQPAEALSRMNSMVRAMHTSSGLITAVEQSTLTVAQAEAQMIMFFNAHCVPQKTVLCGNSIWVDRAFLKKYMPKLEALFHYRMVDVSTIKELASRWYPATPKFEKKKQHTALADVHESIAELQYYRETLFT